MVRRSLLILLSLIFGACTTEAPTATSFTSYRIASTPELESLVISWFEEYQEIDQETLLQIDIISPQVFRTVEDIENVDMIISSYTPPEGWFATPLITARISVVVNRSNNLGTLQIVDLASIFSGKIDSWAAIGWRDEIIQPVIPLQGEASREKFQDIILGGSSFSLTSLVAPTPAFVRQFVSENPGGIGFLLDSNLTGDVQEIELIADGSDEEYSGEQLRLTINAMWSEEPIDNLRAFLVWLQGSYPQ